MRNGHIYYCVLAKGLILCELIRWWIEGNAHLGLRLKKTVKEVSREVVVETGRNYKTLLSQNRKKS